VFPMSGGANRFVIGGIRTDPGLGVPAGHPLYLMTTIAWLCSPAGNNVRRSGFGNITGSNSCVLKLKHNRLHIATIDSKLLT
ncbi:MAG: hypothetical protein WBM52_14415, partial [Thiogranum sp.]